MMANNDMAMPSDPSPTVSAIGSIPIADDAPLSTEQYHTQLCDLIAATVIKCVKEGDGTEWDDAERFLTLALRTVSVHAELAVHRQDELAIAIYKQIDDDQPFGGASIRTLSEMAISDAGWYETAGFPDDGSQKEVLIEYRDKLRASLKRIEARLAEVAGRQ
jgi:hypothetical protein